MPPTVREKKLFRDEVFFIRQIDAKKLTSFALQLRTACFTIKLLRVKLNIIAKSTDLTKIKPNKSPICKQLTPLFKLRLRG